jgi:murein DD-endopeptidase MepM/ murein hydrolase activator NlpD
MFGNPVPGHIQAKSEKWKGTPTFRVTATYRDHIVGKRPPGVDMGNGRVGDPVYAVDDGVIVAAFKDQGNGALIVRQRTPRHIGYIIGYAHMARYHVTVGQAVKRGDMIGVVGMSGADAPHLHWGVTLNGREIDGWPLLDQNTEEDVAQTDVDHYPFPEGNRTWTAKGGPLVAYKPDGSSKQASFKAGSTAQASETANIKQNPLKAPNGSGFILLANGSLAGWYVLNTAGTLAPSPPTGYTQAQLDAAVDEAELRASKGAATDVAGAAVKEAKKFAV